MKKIMEIPNENIDEIELSMLENRTFKYMDEISLMNRNKKLNDFELNWCLDYYLYLRKQFIPYTAKYYAIKKTINKFIPSVEYEKKC
jgi:hypothetical protein